MFNTALRVIGIRHTRRATDRQPSNVSLVFSRYRPPIRAAYIAAGTPVGLRRLYERCSAQACGAWIKCA